MLRMLMALLLALATALPLSGAPAPLPRPFDVKREESRIRVGLRFTCGHYPMRIYRIDGEWCYFESDPERHRHWYGGNVKTRRQILRLLKDPWDLD